MSEFVASERWQDTPTSDANAVAKLSFTRLPLSSRPQPNAEAHWRAASFREASAA